MTRETDTSLINQQALDAVCEGKDITFRTGCKQIIGKYEAAKFAGLPEDRVERIGRAIQRLVMSAEAGIGPGATIENIAKAALAALEPNVIEAEDIDVEIAIAEAIQLMPRNTCYEDKGTPVLKYLKRLGYRVMEKKP